MLRGHSLLGGAEAGPGLRTFQALNPATGEALEPAFAVATPEEVHRAAILAEEAWPALEATGGTRRGDLLRRVAEGLGAIREELVATVPLETALPPGRVHGELDRTLFQLRLMAEEAEGDAWRTPRIHPGDPTRQPPRPDLVARRQALGPVAVFGASNFPLAFGVAGNDTASALAVGCPVVVKAHPLHPATSLRVGRVIQAAVAELGLPEGTFSLLFDDGLEVGQALVRHPSLRAVGFTGSQRGGRALMDLAAARPRPIPVYAEMGSVNPVLVLPQALATRGEAIAQALAASVTLGVGQFCTCPGLILAVEGPGFEAFHRTLATTLAATPTAPMLGATLARAYGVGLGRLAQLPGVEGACPLGPGPNLLVCGLDTFLRTPELAQEVFGPSTLLVRVPDEAGLFRALQALEGQLTATLWMDPGDRDLARRLLPPLSHLAGRVLFNGVPTGVEVSPAMVHGGPYPASSDGRSSSVGTLALERWSRWVCYQNLPLFMGDAGSA